MPPLRPTSTLLEAALAHVVARAEHQCCVGTGFVAVRSESCMSPVSVCGIEKNQVFRERLCLRDDFAVGIEHDAGAVEYEAVVAAHLVTSATDTL